MGFLRAWPWDAADAFNFCVETQKCDHGLIQCAERCIPREFTLWTRVGVPNTLLALLSRDKRYACQRRQAQAKTFAPETPGCSVPIATCGCGSRPLLFDSSLCNIVLFQHC